MKRGVLLVLMLLAITVVSAQYTYDGKDYYVVTSTDPNADTGKEVCESVGKVCVGYTESSDAVCKLVHPNAASSSSVSGDDSGVYCDGAPQTGVCSTKSNACHTCPECTATVDCTTPIGGLYREMFVECAGDSKCGKIQAKSTLALIAEIPSINSDLKSCPINIKSGISGLFGTGFVRVDISMNDGSTQVLSVKVKSKQVVSISNSAPLKCSTIIRTDENSIDQILQSSNRFGTFSALYIGKNFRISGCNFWGKFKLFFIKPVVSFVSNQNKIPLVQPVVTPPVLQQQAGIGPYPGKWACEFYQVPYPGVNKVQVTCAAFKAADTFCTQVLQSPYARAEVCDSSGLIVCSNPCKAPVSQLIPARCPFDNDRARGNQAPPLEFCGSPVAAPAPTLGSAGDVCQHGGQCQTGNCIYTSGLGADRIYRCSCEPLRYTTLGC